MANNYPTQASKATANPKFLEAGQIAVCSVFPLSAALTLGDTITMLSLPVGAIVFDMTISSDTALDTNAASTLAYQVGDGVTATRYIGTHPQGNNQPMSPYHLDQALGHQYQVTATTNKIVITVQAAPATGATTGNLRCTVEYSMDP